MGLSGNLPGKDQPGKSSESSAGRPEAVTGAPRISLAPPAEWEEFRGVFSATMNFPVPRLRYLVAAVVLWAICAVAISRAIVLSLAPLSGLYDAVFVGTNASDFGWSGVHWVFLAICVIAAFFAFGLGFFLFRMWRRLRKRPEGIVGDGIRVLTDGAVEFGVVKIKPVSLGGVSATGRGRIQSVKWKRRAKYSGEREVLINILRTAERDLKVGHLILKVAGGMEAMFLEFVKTRIANQGTLWITKGSEIIWLDRAAVDTQLETVSSVLTPIAQRNSGLLTLTFTEYAADAGESGSNDAASGAIGGAAPGPMLVSATNSLQAEANEQLAGSNLPPAVSFLAGIVKKYGYRLKPNLDVKRFRGW
jgi:hypothetical protein